MNKIMQKIEKILNICLFTSLTVLVIVTFLQVLCRFVFKIPISWSEEVARISFVWLIMLGAALGVKDNSHLSLAMLLEALPKNKRYIMDAFIQITIIGISGFLFAGGISYAIRCLGKKAVTLPIPANCVYICIPVSAALMMMFAINNIIGIVHERREK